MRESWPETAAKARRDLIRLLQGAYSGELAAANAYRGHWKSLRHEREREEILQIEIDELQHRKAVGQLLRELGAGPSRWREIQMDLIGKSIGLLCHFGGWLIPMYGAGKLEFGNIVEYETAARLAWLAGIPEICDGLLEMAEVEWDHEAYFHTKVRQHPLASYLPDWGQTQPRDEIREQFTLFCQRGLLLEPA